MLLTLTHAHKYIFYCLTEPVQVSGKCVKGNYNCTPINSVENYFSQLTNIEAHIHLQISLCKSIQAFKDNENEVVLKSKLAI